MKVTGWKIPGSTKSEKPPGTVLGRYRAINSSDNYPCHFLQVQKNAAHSADCPHAWWSNSRKLQLKLLDKILTL